MIGAKLGLSCICFISCQTASSTPGWQSRGKRRRFVEGIVLAVSDFPDSDVSDYCWHWETQGTREHFVYDKTLKHSNLKVDQPVCKAMERLGSCFYTLHFFLFFFWRSQGVSPWRTSASDFSEQVTARLPFDDRISWKGISQSLISLSSFQSHHCQTLG